MLGQKKEWNLARDREGIMPRERSQTEKDKHHMSNPNRSKPLDTENKLMGGGGECVRKGRG